MTRNSLFAATALLLAMLAAFVGSPTPAADNLRAVAVRVETEHDHITPRELAERLAAGERFRLIDLRDSSAYARSHIENAVRMTLTELLNEPLTHRGQRVLYSEGGIHASQAWVMLALKGDDSVVTLLGGYRGWKETVLNPVLDPARQSQAEIDHMTELSRRFGGTPSLRKTATPKSVIPKKEHQPIVRTTPPTIPPSLPPFQPEEERLREGC